MQISRLKKFTDGFTMVETLAVITIGVLLISVVFYSFSSLRNNSSLQKNVSQAKAILESARYLSISEKSDYSYGVHLQSDRLITFRGSVYISTSTTNSTQLFDGATLDNISLSGGGSDIIFNKITGGTDTYGTFRIKSSKDFSQNKIIRIAGTGIISEE